MEAGGRVGAGGQRGGRGHNPDYQQPGRGRHNPDYQQPGRGRGGQGHNPNYNQQPGGGRGSRVYNPDYNQQPGGGRGSRGYNPDYNQQPGRGQQYADGNGQQGRGQGQRDAGPGYYAQKGRGHDYYGGDGSDGGWRRHHGGRGVDGGGGGRQGSGYHGGGGGYHGGSPGAGPSSSSSQIVPRNSPDPALIAKFASLKLNLIPDRPNPTDRIPVPRPDDGGKATTWTVPLAVNHFRLRFKSSFTLYLYHISKENFRGELFGISHAELAVIKSQHFADHAIAHDGRHTLISTAPIPPTTVYMHFGEKRYYTVRIHSEKMLDIRDTVLDATRETLQAIDVIMRQNSARNAVRLGKGLYFKEPSIPLNVGVVALTGFQQSVKATENGAIMCMDHSVMPFTEKIDIIQFLVRKHIITNAAHSLSPQQRDMILQVLKNFRVTVTHRLTNQKFKVFGLTKEHTDEITFSNTKTKAQTSLVQYYKQDYNKDLRFTKLPCFRLHKTKDIFVPMECCALVGWEPYPKEKLEEDIDAVRKLKNESIPKVDRRYRLITDLIHKQDGPTRGEVLDDFNVEVHEDMVTTNGRVLERPQLKLRGPGQREIKISINQQKCQWNLMNGNKLLKCVQIGSWGVLDLNAGRPEDNTGFVDGLLQKCQNLGINMSNKPLFYIRRPIGVLSQAADVRTILQDCIQTAKGSLQLLICPMSVKHDGYKMLKLVSETEIGITTQCLLTKNNNKANIKKMDQYYANVALKINAKLGGSNFELSENHLPIVGGDRNSRVMYIGADVNHPKSHDGDSLSVVAVVASINWPASTKYSSIVQTQQHRVENITQIGEICSKLVARFATANEGKKPDRIVYFRDGVSDSQFHMVLNKELQDIKDAFEPQGYKPEITVVVAQKRHQTRLFSLDKHPDIENVPAGTVVDKGITAPNSFNFFLCSHEGMLGTSKPTHYYVLWDEHGYSSDDMQKLIYSMCFLFARCTKPVSLVTPVYYADLLAYRGRIYYEATGGVLPELHPSIGEDGMFFL